MSPVLIAYLVPIQLPAVGVGTPEEIVGDVSLVIYCVVTAGGVTAKLVLLHCLVKDVKVVARSRLESSGICSCVCIRFNKQSSQVAVVAADFVCF